MPSWNPAHQVEDASPGGRARWKDSKGNIYEHDRQHDTVEKYSKNGKHIGVYDYRTGKQTTPRDPTREVEK
ncbi:colicin E3/pyocin S6 family cytotoxin [Streptomyces sp. NPDC056169]|uniref:colicin E3/pyocin S6 family cytotoxin n=1 Tax=Streptomyces sp. NPDC056169 TaxID=3345734 RepID=UPI0035E08AA5